MAVNTLHVYIANKKYYQVEFYFGMVIKYREPVFVIALYGILNLVGGACCGLRCVFSPKSCEGHLSVVVLVIFLSLCVA